MNDSMENKPLILIIEDSQESIDLLHYFLEPENYRLHSVLTGKEGLEYLKQHKPDLILLDIMLPDMDGYAVCEEIKKNPETRYIPVIVLTALKELKHKIKAFEAGADDFITKPFDSIELLSRVRSLLRIRSLYDALVEKNRELEERNRQLEAEDQLKQDLIDLIVHDMKNPLFVIQGNLQMMEMIQKLEEPRLQKYVQRMNRSTRNLLRMILNLLDISRIENGRMEINLVKVRLLDFLKRKLDGLAEAGELEGFHIVLDFPEQDVECEIDGDLFGRVIENLMNFMLNNTRTDGKIAIRGFVGSDKLQLLFNHEGSVIPDVFRDKVFEKYAQLELKKAGFKPGKGLGLIFCKHALNLMGIHISLDPAFKGGNQFILEIPVKQ